MKESQHRARLEVLREIGRVLTLPDSADKTKLLEALWVLHGITPESGGGPGEEK